MSKPRLFKQHQMPSNRLQRLLRTHSSASGTTRFGEVVGGTVAECAVVCCCCPCGLVNLLVLALYKVPAGLCRRALRNRRRRCKCGCEEVEIPIRPMGWEDSFSDIEWQKTDELDKEATEFEKEMWDMFYNTGFWRTPSTRERPQNPSPSVNSADSLFHLTPPQPDCR